MFKRCIAILLITSLFANSFQHFFVYAGFEFNQKYIAANLCVNKNRPWLHCNGKCYFMRKVKEAQQKEANTERETQKNLFQDVYLQIDTIIVFHTWLLRLIDTPYPDAMPESGTTELFRPPKFVS